MNEYDVVTSGCWYRPSVILPLFEWVGNNAHLPYEYKVPGYGTKLPGCYCFCLIHHEIDNDRFRQKPLTTAIPKPLDPFGDEFASALWSSLTVIHIDYLYCGKAMKLRARIREHATSGLVDRLEDWANERYELWKLDRLCDLYVAFWLCNEDKRNQLEAELIERLNPVFNKVKSP